MISYSSSKIVPMLIINPERQIFSAKRIKSFNVLIEQLGYFWIAKGKYVSFTCLCISDSIASLSSGKRSFQISQEGECKYQLGKEILTDIQYNNLLQSFPKQLLDEVINRIISHPYIGCLNVNTISQWCMEVKKRQGLSKKNTFNNFSQREYDFEELERVLLAN